MIKIKQIMYIKSVNVGMSAILQILSHIFFVYWIRKFEESLKFFIYIGMYNVHTHPTNLSPRNLNKKEVKCIIVCEC